MASSAAPAKPFSPGLLYKVYGYYDYGVLVPAISSLSISKKKLVHPYLTCAFLISPLLSRFLLRNPQEASRRLSISSADLSFPFLILFSLIFSPTSSCPSETAVPVVATISPVTQYAFCLLFSLHPFGLYYILIFLNLFPFSTVPLWPAEI